MKRFLALVFGLFLFSCEKKVDFTLKEQPDKLVVEATIENGQPPIVILTKSVGYFSRISADILNQSFVHSAEVYVTNGTLTHKLKEYSRSLGNRVTFYYYSIDSSSLATSFVGELNHQYSLRIVSEGKEYTSTTTVPNLNKRIDSVWWKKPPVPTSDSSKVIVMIRATDPPGYGDYVRYYTKTNRGPYYPPLNSTFDDFFIDGTTYELQVDKGVDRNLDINFDSNYFRRGDTVALKLSSIDKATYDFWRTIEFSYSSVGDPFSTPTKVLSNIKGDALGYFGGYASQYRTLIIPH
jgi:Domain of unknown function (DUF4249)